MIFDNRKPEEIKTNIGKWNVWFDLGENKGELSDKSIMVKFILNRKEYPILEEDLDELKKDLKDLGKFRIIKQGKDFLEK